MAQNLAERPEIEEFVRLIRERRKALGLTQVETARLAGCDASFIGDLEKGKPTAQLGKVLDVLKVLGLKWSIQ
jgi:HTH-type transcriptional regulator / antitoxin HipB